VRRAVVIATYAFLFAALVLAVGSAFTAPSLGGASAAFALLAAVTGLVLDRWVAARDRRRELLRALTHEVFCNSQIFNLPELNPNNPPAVARVYPRLAFACLEAAMASGIFTEAHDAALNKRMCDVRQRVGEFNQKLNLTEGLVLGAEDAAGAAGLHTNVTTSAQTQIVIRELAGLGELLVEKYAKETGIDRETTLFAVN